MAYTTIQINSETRERLSKLKSSQRDTYDEIIRTLMGLIPEGDDEGAYTPEFRASLLRSLMDIRRRKMYSLEQVEKQLGL